MPDPDRSPSDLQDSVWCHRGDRRTEVWDRVRRPGVDPHRHTHRVVAKARAVPGREHSVFYSGTSRNRK